jgi:deoxyribonuclease-4
MFGIHINSTVTSLLDEAKRAKDIGATIIQLFVDPLTKYADIYSQFKDYLQANKMKCVVHASYMINLSRQWDDYSSHINQFISQIEWSHKIGAIGIVVHMGKQLDLSKEEAINNMYTSLIHVHNKTKEFSSVKIFLETSTGQGTELCYEVDEFTRFVKKLVHHRNKEIQDRFRICLDTCHIFSAGYDLRTKGTVSMYLDIFEELIGLRYVGLIHLNDSKNILGANVDRHQSLGQGFIGKEGLYAFAKFFQKLNTPIILETPSKRHADEINNYFKH